MFPLFEHVGSPPATEQCLDKTMVPVERLGRNASVPGADESWMDGLSAAEAIRQYGMDPNVILTSEGKFETLDGVEVTHVLFCLQLAQIVRLVQTKALRFHLRVITVSLTKGCC